MFPELKKLERKYPKELVVIGVHSAKFENEKDSENIREAVVRHDLEHPVVNDGQLKIMEAYAPFGARSWPSFVLIDPEGTYVGTTSGEGNYDVFVREIDKLIAAFDKKLDRKEMAFELEKSKMKPGPLLYPGKIAAEGGRIFVSDTRHHRILVMDAAGKVSDVIGSGQEGWADGHFREAKFSQPQGLVAKGDLLYVADTENHRIRELDLKGRRVKTIAGTGEQVYHPRASGEALKTPLNSPWDLALDQDRLFIAMAGNHQIWVMDLAKGTVGAFSGSGREQLTDGAHARAAFNQPSGLTFLDGKLYVADSEISGIREVDPEAGGGVRTVAGTGLFDFGDKDGRGDDVRMQHVLAVHAHGGKLYVTDSYNHKIKICDPKTREVKTLLGDGKRGKDDGKAPRFSEPSGLWAVGEKLYVADQNNHSIRVCDLKTGEVSTLTVTLPPQ